MMGSRRRSRRRRGSEDANLTDAIGRFAVFARASRVRAFDGTNRRRRLTPGRAPRCGEWPRPFGFNTRRGPSKSRETDPDRERRLPGSEESPSEWHDAAGFGGTEVAMLILIAHTGKTVELECDGTSR